ncbi:MAG TPA: winged helix-turn-helix transcriptional regulator [Bacillota bacterium]|nr:winged helix-turn-helix transcriptional regulator [Bacillota bacterium]
MNELSEQARQARNNYQREYRRKHPEKLREYTRRHWEKKAEQYTPEARARDLSSQGYTQRQIADLLNISLGAVNKYVNKHEQ